jgi:hypothetical protein
VGEWEGDTQPNAWRRFDAGSLLLSVGKLAIFFWKEHSKAHKA